MSDLIDALRSLAKRKHDDLSLAGDAADEIERQSNNAMILAQRVADLTAALQREREDHMETIADAAMYLSEAERLRAERDALKGAT
jgi:hypothetical protein